MELRRVLVVYAFGALLLALAGFTAPLLHLAALGFLPLGACLIWAAYDLIDVEDQRGDTAPTPRR